MMVDLYSYWNARVFDIEQIDEENQSVFGVLEEGELVGGVALEQGKRSVKLLHLKDNGEGEVVQATNQIILEFLENRGMTVADLDIEDAEIDSGFKYLCQIGRAHPSLSYLSRSRSALRSASEENPLTVDTEKQGKGLLAKFKAVFLGIVGTAAVGFGVYGIARVINRVVQRTFS